MGRMGLIWASPINRNGRRESMPFHPKARNVNKDRKCGLASSRVQFIHGLRASLSPREDKATSILLPLLLLLLPASLSPTLSVSLEATEEQGAEELRGLLL